MYHNTNHPSAVHSNVRSTHHRDTTLTSPSRHHTDLSNRTLDTKSLSQITLTTTFTYRLGGVHIQAGRNTHTLSHGSRSNTTKTWMYGSCFSWLLYHVSCVVNPIILHFSIPLHLVTHFLPQWFKDISNETPTSYRFDWPEWKFWFFNRLLQKNIVLL